MDRWTDRKENFIIITKTLGGDKSEKKCEDTLGMDQKMHEGVLLPKLLSIYKKYIDLRKCIFK